VVSFPQVSPLKPCMHLSSPPCMPHVLPTFVITNRKEVIHLTLRTDKIRDLVTNWHVFDETSLSYHRYIVFHVDHMTLLRLHIANAREQTGNPIRKAWRNVSRVIHLMQNEELAADMVQQPILLSYHNCPGRQALSSRTVGGLQVELP
jgi:hypothetical protein